MENLPNICEIIGTPARLTLYPGAVQTHVYLTNLEKCCKLLNEALIAKFGVERAESEPASISATYPRPLPIEINKYESQNFKADQTFFLFFEPTRYNNNNSKRAIPVAQPTLHPILLFDSLILGNQIDCEGASSSLPDPALLPLKFRSEKLAAVGVLTEYDSAIELGCKGPELTPHRMRETFFR